MAINPKGPNPPLNQFSVAVSSGVEEIGNLDLSDGLVGRYLSSRLTLLRESVDKLDTPILKSFGSDMLSVMSSWFHKPETLCCLIQGIWSAYVDSRDLKDYKFANMTNLTIGDTSFADFIDMLVTFIDLIMILLSKDIRRFSILIPDFIKEIFQTVMGAILLITQETLFVVRDSILNTLLEWINEKSDSKGIWSKCLPMQQLLDILKKYVHDYGMFAELMEKIRGWISGKTNYFKANIEGEFISNVRDLSYLEWLRDLLLKLKLASIRFDLCVEYIYTTSTKKSNNNQSNELEIPAIFNPTISSDIDSQRFAVFDNNDIGINEDNYAEANMNDSNYTRGIRDNWRTRINKDSIVNFGVSYLGFPKEAMENAYTKYSANDQGTVLGMDSDIEDSCPGFTKAAQLLGFRRGL